MGWKEQYATAKKNLLSDETICSENRSLFRRFFEFQEYKLKRLNRLAELDDPSFKTLLEYVYRFRTVNRWFENQPWESLTKADIQRVYDAVEDDHIRRADGKPFMAKDTYYRRILRAKPFEMAGKAQLAREVMQFYSRSPKQDPRFINEEAFRKIVDVVPQPRHKAFFWLAWDVGENVGALLQLCPSDFQRRSNEDTNDPEYVVSLRRPILKRSRTPRTEITNYAETVKYLDMVLASHAGDGPVFAFGRRMAAKSLDRATRITGVRCQPNGDKVKLKDLRSSMACDLLSKDWTTDEVNRRLGHRPGSQEIAKYVNWLALDSRRPKRKLQETQVQTVTRERDDFRERLRLMGQRQEDLQAELRQLRETLEQNNRLMHEQFVRIVRNHAAASA